MNDGGMLLVGCVFCELLVGAGYALYDGGQQAVVKACRNNEIYQTQSLVMACKIIKETK